MSMTFDSSARSDPPGGSVWTRSRIWAVAAAMAVLTASCGGGESDQTSASSKPAITNSPGQPVAPEPSVAATMVTGDATIKVDDGAVTVRGVVDLRIDSILAVDRNEVFFSVRGETEKDGVALAKVDLKTGNVTRSHVTWSDYGELISMALTPAHVWAVSPKIPGESISRSYTVLDRATMATVGEYDVPDGGRPAGAPATVGSDAYVLVWTNPDAEAFEAVHALHQLSVGGAYGEPRRLDGRVNSVLSTGDRLIVVPARFGGEGLIRIIEPSSLVEVGRFVAEPFHDIRVGEDIVITRANERPIHVYNITDPAKVIAVQGESSSESSNPPFIGDDLLFTLDSEPDQDDYQIQILDPESLMVRKTIMRTSFLPVREAVNDGTRMCLLSGTNILTCVTLEAAGG